MPATMPGLPPSRCDVHDGGAGTGIATRQLAQRGARMPALDLGERMLRHAQARSPGLACVVADGNDGQMSVPYLSRMWLARRRYSPAAR